MKHHTLALICFSAFFILQTGLLCAKSEEPATDYVGAMFNLNFVFPIEFASSSDDDVEDLYGAFFHFSRGVWILGEIIMESFYLEWES